ncbi:hypothetical protein P154DRAFT_432372 [Amniculicola lignicola CBS 123094]|uniref:Xylanolytic transcriptional activator regulatory domain-containing protein n=1 Tax=Amniculicola lignicola CBS 123094 TaxID=1392246 RepID=A0A6A5WIU0_9PLEO|nr:hypothetical protein P154DRAFT_432372 [Amniculicola lignicola CBS 123094]
MPPRLITRLCYAANTVVFDSGEKIQALVHRLSTLEGSVLVNPNQAVSRDADTRAKLQAFAPTPPASHGTTRSVDVDFYSEKSAPGTPDGGGLGGKHHAIEARDLIQEELSRNGLLSQNQRRVLETAVSFVVEISRGECGDLFRWSRKQDFSTEITAGEIAHVILATQKSVPNPPELYLQSIDHIPPKVAERIALALLEGKGDEQTLNLYRILIHFKALVVLYDAQMRDQHSLAVQQHVRELQMHHLHAAIAGLSRVSLLAPPSLLLLQALVAGAMLMQIAGDPNACWSLTAVACRTMMALGYHNIRDTTPLNDLDEEIYAAVAWCIHFDRCMSFLLVRPPTLPSLDFTPAPLIRTNPRNILGDPVLLMMEMAPVQEKILELTLKSAFKKPRVGVVLKEEVDSLRVEMSNIYARLETARLPYDSTCAEGLLHWQSLEFKFFSTLTAIHRLSPTITSDPVEREECLRCARKALVCITDIQNEYATQGFFVDECNPYMSWTVLSYPLCPFFVVFCNVVGTSNAQDFRMLEEVTAGMANVTTGQECAIRLCKLCSAMVNLCRPLIEGVQPVGNISLANQEILHTSQNGNVMSINPVPEPGHGLCATDFNGESCDGQGLVSWDDDMMWQLFQNQPSLNWFNTNILDSTTNFL